MGNPQADSKPFPSQPAEKDWDWHSWEGAFLIHGAVVLAWSAIGLLATLVGSGSPLLVVYVFTSSLSVFCNFVFNMGFNGFLDMLVGSWLTGAVYLLPILFYVRTRNRVWLYVFIPVAVVAILMTVLDVWIAAAMSGA